MNIITVAVQWLEEQGKWDTQSGECTDRHDILHEI